MARLEDYKKVKITEICTYERAKKNKIYNRGCFCIQVSATRGQTFYLDSDQEVESHYCVFTLTNDNYDPFYVFVMFQNGLADFLAKTQTGLNIRPEIFEEYEIDLHTDIKTQQEIGNAVRLIEERINEQERLINNIGLLKKYHLGKMFVGGE